MALVIKWSSGTRRDEGPIDPVDRLIAEVSGVTPGVAADVVAITSDGWAFVPDDSAVMLMGPADEGEVVPSAEHARRVMRLSPGDLIGARVKRGAPDFDPWRLEALGRDGDYQAWFFETQDAAESAMDLLERHVVRAPKNEDGEPHPPAGVDFDTARRQDEETERALDSDDDSLPN